MILVGWCGLYLVFTSNSTLFEDSLKLTVLSIIHAIAGVLLLVFCRRKSH